jgi:tetratricopeptide (TPR) repeat protein
MEPLFQERPDHPGIAHYLIHAFDAPAIADDGLAAALRYAEIAPDAPHALHMPTHIFTRLGHWEESIELNARSAAAEPDPNAAVHPLDYMVYAYLQLGRDREAGEVVGRARDIPDRFYGGLIGYNFAAMQARYALERNRWEDAAAVPIPVGALPYVEAVARFARAVGFARSGRVQGARAETAVLATLETNLRTMNEAYWATVVNAQRLAAEAWVARAAGDDASALRLATEAADLEATFEKHPVTPGPLLPAAELLGDLLLDLGRPADARVAYERTLTTEPGRARALYGAARAAEAAGEAGAAGRHYGELLRLLEGADLERPDLVAARAWQARQ